MPITKHLYFHLYQFIPDKLAHDVDNAPAVCGKELVGPLIERNHLEESISIRSVLKENSPIYQSFLHFLSWSLAPSWWSRWWCSWEEIGDQNLLGCHHLWNFKASTRAPSFQILLIMSSSVFTIHGTWGIGKSWLQDYPPFHIWFLTKASMWEICRQAGSNLQRSLPGGCPGTWIRTQNQNIHCDLVPVV